MYVEYHVASGVEYLGVWMCGGVVEKPMSIAFDCFCLMVSLTKPSAVEFSTWIGMAGCGCPSSRSKVRIGTPSWPLM